MTSEPGKKKELVGQRKNRESEQKLPKSVAKSYLLCDNSIQQNSGRKHFRLVSHVADANRNSSRTRIATSYRSDAATGRKGVRKPCASTERRMITKRFLEGAGRSAAHLQQQRHQRLCKGQTCPSSRAKTAIHY